MDTKDLPQPTQQEIQTKNLTPEYAARVLFLSYKYSQGDPQTQKFIFQYLHSTRPEWKIKDEEFKQKIFDKALASIKKYVPTDRNPTGPKAFHKTVPDFHEPSRKVIEEDIKNQINFMQTFFADVTNSNPLALAEVLSSQIIARDEKFLLKGRSRVRSGTDPTTPSGDPYGSHIIDYVLKGSPTGLAEFDRMFSDIKKFVIGPHDVNSSWSGTSRTLDEIIDFYNEKHPNNTYSKPASST